MKLRIKGDSLRLRLTRGGSSATCRAAGPVEEHVHISLPQASFTYRLRRAPERARRSARHFDARRDRDPGARGWRARVLVHERPCHPRACAAARRGRLAHHRREGLCLPCAARAMRTRSRQFPASQGQEFAAVIEFDFALGESVDLLRKTVREFSAELIAPRAAEIDASNLFPRDLWPELGALGLLGITVEPEYGGSGLGLPRARRRDGGDQPRERIGRPVIRRAFEPLRESAAPLGNGRAEAPLSAAASERRTRRRARDERAGGRLRCGRHAPDRLIGGRSLPARWPKMWITNGPSADVLVVYAQDGCGLGHARASPRSSSRRAFPDSARRRNSTSSACAARTPANSCSMIAACRSRTCCIRPAAACRC